MIRRLLLGLCLYSGVLLAETPEAASDSSVVAKIGESDVRLSELRTALGKLDLKDQAQLGQDPAKLNQVVRVLLVQKLMLDQAKAKEWDKKPEVVAAMERAREIALSESYLQSVSEPPSDFPSDAEVSSAYESVKAQIGSPKQWKLAQIFVSAPPEVTKEQLTKAETRLEAAKKALAAKSPDFSALATEFSDDKISGAQGGEIGWLAEPGILSEIRTEATLLARGEVSKPIRLKDGWHILKCLDIRDAYTPKLAEIREPLRVKLREERAKTNSQAFVAKLLQENPLVVNEIVLKEALKQPSK